MLGDNASALYVPVAYGRDRLRRALHRVMLPRWPKRARLYFSAESPELGLSERAAAPASMFTPLHDGIGQVFVLRGFSALHDNAFTRAWLLSLARDTNTRAWVYATPRAGRARAGFLTRRTLPAALRRAGARVHTSPSPWVGIDAVPECALRDQPTIFGALHDRFNEFLSIYTSARARGESPEDPEHVRAASSTYVYSLFGANQKSWLIEGVLAELGLRRPLRILDVGAGFGFLAAELAHKGHSVTAVDRSAWQIEGVGGWLAERCGVPLTVRAGAMEHIEQVPGTFDLVCFTGSLLLAEREQLPHVLESAMAKLAPGGTLLVHENPSGARHADTPVNRRRFAARELDSYLRAHAGRPQYFFGNAIARARSVDDVARCQLVAVVRAS